MPRPGVIILLSLGLTALGASGAAQSSIPPLSAAQAASLVATYKSLHAAPELSHYEQKTSATLAGELRAAGFTVTEHVGKYASPSFTSYGVVAVMKNGAGPTVMYRTDLDALPIEEKTGLPFASTVHMKNDAGQDVPVMHACGHDIHLTTMIGTARMLASIKDRWHGTLVLIGQPSEEISEGAQALLADGLYTRFPKPDMVIGLHDNADLETGKVGYTIGDAFSSATSVDMKVRGIGGHGSRPEAAKDPIVLASQIVLALQTIVSRENAPLDPAVVTVGSIHGGTKHNVIPDEVDLQITLRAYREDVRRRMLASIERIARGTAIAAGIPDTLLPIVQVNGAVTPAVYNDPKLTERLAGAWTRALGADRVTALPPAMVSEDFARYSLDDHSVPTTIFWLGAVDPASVARSKETHVPLPTLHSALFAPVPESTIRTGIAAMTAAVLELMK
jgi:amidohydrolase